MTDKDGGPAFPHDVGTLRDTGMSLRDWFAGQALQSGVITSATPSVMAQVAYQIADAMLAEREKRNG